MCALGSLVIDIATARAHSRQPPARLQRTAPLRITPAPSATGAVAMVDWEVLLDAVKVRLRQVQAKADVLDCVGALEQLHRTLAHQVERSRSLQQSLLDVQAALVTAHADFAGTRASERVARHLAMHGDLTALPNGGVFREHLDRPLQEGTTRNQALAVLCIDLAGFKAINDCHGHATGDELLRIIATRLSSAVRVDDTVGRLGGDEFACLAWVLPPDRLPLTRLARGLFDAVSAPFQIGALSLRVQPSIGIAVAPGDGATAAQVLRHADAAMYRAKRQECGHAFFHSGTDA